MRRDSSTRPTSRLARSIRFVQFLLCVSLALALLSGCTRQEEPEPQNPEPQTFAVLEPVEIRGFSLDGQLVTASKDRSISPDGKYLLAAILSDTIESMAAIPVGGNDDTVSPNPVPFYEIDTSWTDRHFVRWFPLGWTSHSQCVFAIHGWQDKGPRKGQRGTAIYTADIETGNASLISYVDIPEEGEDIEEAVLAADGKAYMRISSRYLEFDLESGTCRVVRDDLPTYHNGISMVAVSPKGDKIVYGVYGEDKSGVYIIDVSSGAEIPLVETGESLSFYPTWSPDGEYIAMYTLHRVANPSGSGAARYNFVAGEYGIVPSAEEITVMNSEGSVVRTFSLEDQYLSHLYWLHGSGSLVFISGPAEFGKWGEVISHEYESVWIADVTGDGSPVKVADLRAIEEVTGERTSYVFPVASLPEGAGALINVAGATGASIWLVSPAAPPSKVADGWWENARLNPVYLDSVVGTIAGGTKSHLYLIGPNGSSQVGGETPAGTSIEAYTGELLVTSVYDFGSNRTEVTVYKMIGEKTLE